MTLSEKDIPVRFIKDAMIILVRFFFMKRITSRCKSDRHENVKK